MSQDFRELQILFYDVYKILQDLNPQFIIFPLTVGNMAVISLF